MYCGNCGNHLKEGDRFCGKCGAVTNLNNQPQMPISKPKEDQTTPNLLTLVSFLCFFIVPAFFSGLDIRYVGGVSYLVGLTLLIYTRIKYPKNILSIVLMVLVIVFTILAILGMIFLAISCGFFIRDCQGITYQ